MTANVRPTLGQEDAESFGLFRCVKDFIDRVFGYSQTRIEDDLIFRGYYYRILIRHLRITFGIMSLIFVITGFFFMDPPSIARMASHFVFGMISVISLGISFLPFFRMIWRAYMLVFAIVAFAIAYASANSMAVTVEISVIALIAVCLMSGLPFGLSFVLAIVNMLFFQGTALRNGANTLAMVRSNSFFICYIVFLMYAAKTRVRGIRAQFDTIETVKVQRRKSDSIIQHMLPPFVVQKLKAKHDSVIVDHFDSVTVMFCEIVNFNTLLEKMPAHEVVQLLNDIYTAFDRLTDVHGVNKVEHIGNVYVVSAGCPEVTPYHSGRVAEMGLKMLSVVRHFKKVELRLGIHTGAVMAGVIGFKKLSYHLFGDTINTASRMSSHGAIQRIHVSEATFQLLSSKYIFESRGEIDVKGKGVMRTYFLDGRKMSNAYMHGNFAQERYAFASNTHGAYIPPQPSPNTFFRPFSAGMAPSELASEFSYNSNSASHAGVHRTSHGSSGYLAARSSTASMHAPRDTPQTSFSKKLLSFAGTPDHTPVQALEDGEEEVAIERYHKNIFTLRFSGEEGIEEAFREHNAHVHHVRMCCSMIFTLIGFAFCGIYDHYYAHGPRGPYYALRFLFCGFGIVCIVMAVKFRQYVEFITLFVLAGTQFVTLALELWAHGNAPISLAAVILTMFISSMTFNVSCVRFIFSTIVFLIGFALFQFLQLLQKTPSNLMGVYSTFIVFAIAMNIMACYMQERYERDNWVHELVLDDEIDKTDALLTGLLPVSVLVELKEGRQLIADQFDQVSIMLTDIVGFTEIASRITPAQLVEMLNVLFSVFDRLAEKYGVLKIATIGDAYLCTAGCPEKSDDHAEKIANMALEMVESVKAIIAPDGTQVRVRIGMHTGPVIAGVVGIKMIHYQVWGDSVQIAQKMESSGKASHIHVSKHAHALLEKNFIFEPADVVKIKNSDMATYFLKGRLNPKHPIMAMKRGYQTVGPNTPRVIDLSSSMIFQNANSWSMRKPSSPPPLTQSQRMLSNKRYPRTPRRGDMLTPLPTHRARKMSMLGGRPDVVELGDTQDTPVSSFILDNILGRNSFNESSEVGALDHAEDYNYEDDVISTDEYAMLGNSPSAMSDVARREDDDELISPTTNFSLRNGLRLTSLVVSPVAPKRLPPSPSGVNLTVSLPFPATRDLRTSNNASSGRSSEPSTRARSDSLNEPSTRVRSDSLTVPNESVPRRNSLSRSCEQPPRIRSNSLTRTNSRSDYSHSPQYSPVFSDSPPFSTGSPYARNVSRLSCYACSKPNTPIAPPHLPQ